MMPALSNIHLLTFASMLLFMESMVLSGLPLQDSNYTTMSSTWPRKMAQQRKLIVMNSKLHSKLLRETEKELKLVSEWPTKSTCLSSTTPRVLQLILAEKVVEEHVLPLPLLAL